ncbi:hypothetical protein A8W25_24975 [Streptomyces sp. ERV7]|nr:hypothetical protein A8W25_24975 [Streptomyces sp. ERV7]
MARTWSSATRTQLTIITMATDQRGASVFSAIHSGMPTSSRLNWRVVTALSTVTARYGRSRTARQRLSDGVSAEPFASRAADAASLSGRVRTRTAGIRYVAASKRIREM